MFDLTYSQALLIDITVVVLCAVILINRTRLSHAHPATIYFFFHVYTFTWRLYACQNGAPTLFSEWGPSYYPMSELEIVRASQLADVALVSMTAAWLVAQRKSDVEKRSNPTEPSATPLNPKIIWYVVAVAMPLGIVGQLLYTALPTPVLGQMPGGPAPIDVGGWRESSWLQILQAWPGLLLLMLIYLYGFRWWLVLPMLAYLGVMSIQGYHRFRVIIPALLLFQIYLDRRSKRWPGATGTILIAALGIAFFPLKTIGKLVQERASTSEIVDAAAESITSAGTEGTGDQQFLDEFACTLSLVDANGKFYYGEPYLGLLTLPIPRNWWPEKPGLADYLQEISRPWRPMAEQGMIMTYIGDAYANFGYAGIIAIPFGLAYFLARACNAAYRRPYLSTYRFMYLLLACNFITVFRDTLMSIVLLTLVQMMPLTATVALHRFAFRFKRQPRAGPALVKA